MAKTEATTTEATEAEKLTPEATEAVKHLQAVTEMAGSRLSFSEAIQLAANTCVDMGVSALLGLK